eukprot:5304801-Prymnesium_polylepis.1
MAEDLHTRPLLTRLMPHLCCGPPRVPSRVVASPNPVQERFRPPAAARTARRQEDEPVQQPARLDGRCRP